MRSYKIRRQHRPRAPSRRRHYTLCRTITVPYGASSQLRSSKEQHEKPSATTRLARAAVHPSPQLSAAHLSQRQSTAPGHTVVVTIHQSLPQSFWRSPKQLVCTTVHRVPPQPLLACSPEAVTTASTMFSLANGQTSKRVIRPSYRRADGN